MGYFFLWSAITVSITLSIFNAKSGSSGVLKNISESDIYDVGTGKGVSIFEIISKLKLNKKYITYKNKKISEIIKISKTLLFY